MARKRRRIRFHRRLSLVLALALSVALAFWLLKRSAFLPYQVSKFVNEHYFEDTPFRFSCSGVTGDLVNRVTLEKPSLEYSEGRRRFTIFRASRVTVDYRLLQLLKLKLIVDELALSDVRLQFVQDDEGRIVLPILPGTVSPEREAVSPHVEVRRFTIDGLQLFFSGGERKLMVRDISLSGSLEYADGAGSIEIENGSGYLSDSETSIRSLRTSAGFQGENVRLDEFVVRLDRSFIMATGGYDAGELRHLQLVFNPVDLMEISEMGLLPRNEGELGGSVVLEGPLDSLSLEGSVTGNGWGLAFGGLSFSGVLAGDELSLTQIEGDVFESHINGGLTYVMGNDGGYSFEGSCSELDLSYGFLPGSSAPETDLFGRIQMVYSRPEDSYEFEADLDSAVVNGFEASHLKISSKWTEETGLDFDEIRLERPGFTVRGSGRIDAESQADMLFSLNGDRLDYLWRFLSLPQIDGSVDVRGKVTGPIGRLQINLNGEIQDADFLFASVDSGMIQAQINDAPSESASVRIDLRGRKLSLRGQEFSSPHVLLEATPEGTVVKDFSFAKGDTFITMDFNVRPDSQKIIIGFRHISIASKDEEWKTIHPFSLTISEGAGSLDSLVLSSHRGIVGVLGDYSTETGSCSISGWGEGIDHSLFKDAAGLPIRFSGRSRFNISVLGDIENPNIDLSVSLREGVIDSLSFNRLDLQGAFVGSDGYRLDRLMLAVGGDSLIASGSWRFPGSPVRILRQGFSAEEAFASPLALRLKSHTFPLATMLKAMHADLRPSGAFSGEVSFERTPASPRIRVTGTLSEAKKGGIHLPEVACELLYEDSLLSIRQFSFDDGRSSGQIQGEIPLALDLSRGLRLRKEASVRLEGSIESEDLKDLHQYFDRLARTSGKMSGEFGVGGSLENPSLTGKIDFEDCSLRLSGMEEVYKDIKAEVAFEDDLIRLASLTGKEGKKGRFHGSGLIQLDGFKAERYQVDVYFEDLEIASVPDIESTQDGHITVASQLWEDGRLIPNITGSVQVKQAQIVRSLGMGEGPPSAASIPTASPDWICSIDIEALKNVWVKNPDLKMEIGGEVILKRDEQGLYIRGELEVLRGWYSIYNNKFRILDGTFDFSKTNTLRPELFLNAYTPYRREGDREHRIFLHLSWPFDKKEPQLTLSYDEPGYSETDIWKMLGGTYVSPTTQTGQAGGGSWDAAGTAQGIASNYLERILNAQMTDVTIDVESRAPQRGGQLANGEREMTIAIGKYLSEDLYLKYRQGLSISSERAVDIEYRISNMVLIRSEIIRHSGKLFLGQRRQATDEINLDIKFRFEY